MNSARNSRPVTMADARFEPALLEVDGGVHHPFRQTRHIDVERSADRTASRSVRSGCRTRWSGSRSLQARRRTSRTAAPSWLRPRRYSRLRHCPAPETKPRVCCPLRLNACKLRTTQRRHKVGEIAHDRSIRVHEIVQPLVVGGDRNIALRTSEIVFERKIDTVRNIGPQLRIAATAAEDRIERALWQVATRWHWTRR